MRTCFFLPFLYVYLFTVARPNKVIVYRGFILFVGRLNETFGTSAVETRWCAGQTCDGRIGGGDETIPMNYIVQERKLGDN